MKEEDADFTRRRVAPERSSKMKGGGRTPILI